MTRKTFEQGARFAVTGVANTAVDFLIFNSLLLAAGGTAAGLAFAAMKAVAFAGALGNSFLLNKYWVFAPGSGNAKSSPQGEGRRFLAVSVAGFFLNVAASWAVFSLLSPVLPGGHMAANLSAAAGTLAVLAWNFAGYKLFVFKPQTA